MMKIFFFVIFMSLMLLKNKLLMFYYNLCYLISVLLVFSFYFKDNLWINISLNFGVSYYSILLVMMTIWIVGLMMMCLNNIEEMKMMMFIFLLLMMIFFFFSMDLLLFYFSFEVSLIPTFFLILYWGVNYERVSAAYYLFMYMLLFSFPLLVYIMDMYFYSMTFKFSLMSLMMWGYVFNMISFLMIYMAFLIKMPMYLFHLWLPKAHVEAPVYGSMILAGVLLKMGSYGLLRLNEMFMVMGLKYNYLIFSIGVIGSMLVGLLCMVQIDMKSLVAYSSVVHMNMVLCSLMTMNKLGVVGGYIMMITHGLCSSGLFYMVNLYYSRTQSRLLVLNKGMLSVLPSLSMWWFYLCVANFSFPLSMNFFSEIIMLSVIINWEVSLMFYLMLICFFSSAYSLYLFSYIQHGSSYLESNFLMSNIKEKLVLVMHIYPLILIMFNMIMFM